MHAIVVSSEKGKGTRDYFGSPFFHALMQAALFNASLTISGYYQAEVNHDMPQLPWH